MPTYVCYLPPDLCGAEQKAKIAEANSERHSEATGAPPYFVQVQIEETRADRFLGRQASHAFASMQKVLHRTEFKHGLHRTIVNSQFRRWGVRLTQRRDTELLPSWQPDRHLPPANDGLQLYISSGC